MNLKRTLLLAAGAYALGRVTAKLTSEDFRMAGERIRSMSGGDLRKYAMTLTDDALEHAGLVRKANVAGPVGATIGGLGAGMLLGAGMALLFAPRSGSETRHMIGERVKNIRPGNGQQMETSPETTGQRP
jgi:hypothetical protein